MPGLDLFLVFLVRDPQAVVASIGRRVCRRGARRLLPELRHERRPVAHVRARTAAFSSQPPQRRLFVRYEDLVERPEVVLRTILDVAGSTAELPDLAHLRTGRGFHANRLIGSDEVALGRTAAAGPARDGSC